MEDFSDEGYSYAFSKVHKNPNFALNYKNVLYTCVKSEEDFIAFALYKIFHNENFQGKRLLDIGCGPTVHRMAAASAFFSEIIVSDYSEHNCENVKKWLNNESSSDDWNALLEQSAILEGYGSRDLEKGINIINSRIREKIKKVLPCDVLQKKIIPMEIGKFDVLHSSYCLEAACTTPEIYKSTIKKLKEYILPGGELVMVVTLDSSYYIVYNNEEKLPLLTISRQLVNEALEEAGLKKKDCYLMEVNDNNPNCNFRGVLIVSAINEKHLND